MGRAAKVQSFFESAMTDFTKQLHKGYNPIWTEDEEGLKYFVPYKENELSEVILGFCFDKNIIVPTCKKYNTEVYKLLRYYPWDEKTEDFFFDVNNP